MINANDLLEMLALAGLERIPMEIIIGWPEETRKEVYTWAASQCNDMPEAVRRLQYEVMKFILRDLEYLEGVCDANRNDRGVNRINNIRNNLKRIRRA